MSVGLYQNIIYGYKTTYEQFEELTKDVKDLDEVMANNVENGAGWLVGKTDNGHYAIFGQIVMSGEDSGNNSLLVAESMVQELPVLTSAEKTNVEIKMIEVFPGDEHNECKYYVVGEWA